MTWWQIALAVWFGVGLALFIGINVAIRNEPTAHGQAVGCQMSLAMFLGWPILLPMLIANGVLQAIKDRRWKREVERMEANRLTKGEGDKL